MRSGLGAAIVFIIDYVTRLALAQHRAHDASRHLLDLAVIALPILRPLRLLRLVMLRALNRSATASLRGRLAIYVSGGTVLLLFCASLAVLDAERHRGGANINNFGDALWWSATTITTVGYGDHYPVTTVAWLTLSAHPHLVEEHPEHGTPLVVVYSRR